MHPSIHRLQHNSNCSVLTGRAGLCPGMWLRHQGMKAEAQNSTLRQETWEKGFRLLEKVAGCSMCPNSGHCFFFLDIILWWNDVAFLTCSRKKKQQLCCHSLLTAHRKGNTFITYTGNYKLSIHAHACSIYANFKLWYPCILSNVWWIRTIKYSSSAAFFLFYFEVKTPVLCFSDRKEHKREYKQMQLSFQTVAKFSNRYKARLRHF